MGQHEMQIGEVGRPELVHDGTFPVGLGDAGGKLATVRGFCPTTWTRRNSSVCRHCNVFTAACP